MEFGETIPLFFMSLCCIAGTPIVGFALLAVIRFKLKDRQLARNIFFTVIILGLLSFLFPVVRFAWSQIVIPRGCGCDSSLIITPEIKTEMLLSDIQFGAFLIYPGIGLGFILAFFGVVPITLVVRYIKKRKMAHFDTQNHLPLISQPTPESDSGQSDSSDNP